MSILIKGMETPVTCCYCPLIAYDPEIEWNDGGRETQGAYICVMTHELIDNTKREEHCPLVPVPPHGRLIDADALKKHIDSSLGRVFNGVTVGEALKIMADEMPIIIPADPAEEVKES